MRIPTCARSHTHTYTHIPCAQRAKSLTQRWSEGPSVLLSSHPGLQSHDREPCHPQSDVGGPSSRPSSEHRPFLPSPLPSFSATLSLPAGGSGSSSSSPSSLTFPTSTAATSTTAAASQAPTLPNWLDRLRARRSGIMDAAPVPTRSSSPHNYSSHRGDSICSGEVASSALDLDLDEQFLSHRGLQVGEEFNDRGTPSSARNAPGAAGSCPLRHEGQS
eukprot:scaffold11032_cov18-Tisochrysis_lutea.AAC.3